MQREYKVGDKVKSLFNMNNEIRFDADGIIKEYVSKHSFLVDFGGFDRWCSAEDVEFFERKPIQKRHRRPHSKIANAAIRKVDEIKKLHISNSRKVQLIGFVVNQTNLFE